MTAEESADRPKRSSWTVECSGCFEPGECGSNASLYDYDAKARCYVGAGCHECGYTGKRRMEWLP